MGQAATAPAAAPLHLKAPSAIDWFIGRDGHARPGVLQHHVILASDHVFRQLLKPSSQSYWICTGGTTVSTRPIWEASSPRDPPMPPKERSTYRSNDPTQNAMQALQAQQAIWFFWVCGTATRSNSPPPLPTYLYIVCCVYAPLPVPV